jgi:hypothetical protein
MDLVWLGKLIIIYLVSYGLIPLNITSTFATKFCVYHTKVSNMEYRHAPAVVLASIITVPKMQNADPTSTVK